MMKTHTHTHTQKEDIHGNIFRPKTDSCNKKTSDGKGRREFEKWFVLQRKAFTCTEVRQGGDGGEQSSKRRRAPNHNNRTIDNSHDQKSTTASPPTPKTMSLILIERGMTSGTALRIRCNHGNIGLYCQGAKEKI